MEGEGRATVDFYGILGIPLIIQTSPLIITIHRSLIAQLLTSYGDTVQDPESMAQDPESMAQDPESMVQDSSSHL